jgi:hypothetical protein
MRRRFGGRTEAATIVALAAGVWLYWPGARTAAIAGALCALFLVGLVRLGAEAAAMRRPGESEFDDAMSPVRSARPRPEDLKRAERVFGWKRYSPEDFEHRIRPQLTRLIRVGVLARRGSDVTRDPTAAEGLPRSMRAIVDGPAPEEPFDTRRLEMIVNEIEAL